MILLMCWILLSVGSCPERAITSKWEPVSTFQALVGMNRMYTARHLGLPGRLQAIKCRKPPQHSRGTNVPFDPSQATQELQKELGRRLQQLRLSLRLSQGHVAERAGISERSLRNLEGGKGSTLETLLRVLGVLDLLPALDQAVPLLGPTPRISARPPSSAD